MSLDPGVQLMLDLSTAHMPGEDQDFGGLRTTCHEYGVVVFVSPATEEEDRDHRVPEWIRPIHREAVERGCMLINFDRDAETVDRFKTWSW